MRTVFVDSRDAIPGGTSCDFSIALPSTITFKPGARFRVDNVRLPISVPTIQWNKNNTLIVRVGSTDYTATFWAGQWDGPGLANAIQGHLQSVAPGSWTVSYDTGNLSMRISCSNNFTIVGGTYFTQLARHPYSQTANSYAFQFVSVQGEDIICLCSSTFASTQNLGPKGSSDLLLACVVTAPFGSVQSFDMPWDTWLPCPQTSVNTLSFQLRDRSYGLMTNFIPNVSFTITIDD